MKKTLRIITQIVFLALFALLFAKGRIQLWLAVFGSGALLSLVFSRFYCGWICPMNSLFRPLGWLYSKLGIKRLKTPGLMRHSVFRYAFLALFVVLMLITRKLGIDVHLPALLLVLSFLVTLFFEEALWHNNVCPYGTILNVAARKAVKSEKIDESACISCGKCRKVCPVHCIDMVADTKKLRIRTRDCVTCHACEAECPTRAISYR
ncbi:MAG: hypothetical protein A2Y38_18010 [Spirochaetes bacterium GWB1_59_5]|nr:MAG: hypothetical protein A2Y38_18010 [Spirochaetes bacterium GWB1_59_5]